MLDEPEETRYVSVVDEPEGQRYLVVVLAVDDCARANHEVEELPNGSHCLDCERVAGTAARDGLDPDDAVRRFRSWSMDREPWSPPDPEP